MKAKKKEDLRRTCSECGQEVHIMTNTEDYMYKTHTSSHASGEARHLQCGYTCYTHATLRLNKNKTISKENYIKYVLQTERTMKSQGKTILHPIEIKDGKK